MGEEEVAKQADRQAGRQAGRHTGWLMRYTPGGTHTRTTDVYKLGQMAGEKKEREGETHKGT